MTELETAFSGGAMAAPDVSLRGITKSFTGRRVLRDVDLNLRHGEVHALLGANGAGKSTLIKVLCGHFAPEAGSISIRGKTYQGLGSPQEALRLGIRVVHQETPLFDTLSVAECIGLFLQYPTGLAGRIRWRSLNRRASELLTRFGVDLDPRRLCARLSASERAMVSVAMALGGEGEEQTAALILDEASAAVPEAEAGRFLGQIRELATSGTPVLMVTHRLAEVGAVADYVTILNDGIVVYQGPPLPSNQMIGLMTSKVAVAEDISEEVVPDSGANHADPERKVAAQRTVLCVQDLRTERLGGVSFEVRAGECLGLVGNTDSGHDDIPMALVGAARVRSGRIVVGDQDSDAPKNPRAALRAGIALVPRDRLHQGGVASLSMSENLLLPSLGRFWFRPGLARRVVDSMITELDIRPPKRQTLMRELSGGNQQKLILAKWLTCQPRLLILDDPTIGVDPGARRKLFEVVRHQIEMGLAVILLTSEPEQFVEMCDRVLAFSGGRIVDEISPPRLTYQEVARWAAA